MSDAVFEKAGQFSFTVTRGRDATEIAPDSLVSARIYSPSPTDAQIEDDADALSQAVEYITTWTDGPNLHEKIVNYAAIADPEPKSSREHEQYYFVFSYRLESGGTIVREVEPFTIYRPHVISSRFGVTENDVYAVESKLGDIYSDEVQGRIALAARLVKQELRGKGYDIRKLEQEDAKDLVRFKAVFLCCMALSYETGDRWDTKAEFYKQSFEHLMAVIPLGYDADDDGDIEPGEEVTASPSVWFAMR